jgi:caffeoyl-CoA O-methyltransferase
MSDITDPVLEAYAEAHTTAPEAHLLALAEETRATLMAPQMMVGALEGRFLEMLVYALRPAWVLEIGTFSGYSALSMAAGLAPGGRITTCELSPQHAAVAQAHIARSPYANRIEVIEGRALDTVASLDGPFDFVFIDADKTNYLAYFEAVLPKLAPGGLIAVDNTLWGGNVVHEDDQSDDTRAIRAFNDAVVGDPRVVCVQLTVRDGVTLIRPSRAAAPGGRQAAVSGGR